MSTIGPQGNIPEARFATLSTAPGIESLKSTSAPSNMATAGDEARRRIDEIKWRNLGGSMEEIPGFNLTYNDAAPEEEVDETPVWAPPPKPTVDPRVKPFFPHAQTRGELRAAGKLKTRDVIEHAKARDDGKALRAHDGAVLKVPYVVRLKPRKVGGRR